MQNPFPAHCPISTLISTPCCFCIPSYMARVEIVKFLSQSTKGEQPSLTARYEVISHFPNENMIQKKKKIGGSTQIGKLSRDVEGRVKCPLINISFTHLSAKCSAAASLEFFASCIINTSLKLEP